MKGNKANWSGSLLDFVLHRDCYRCDTIDDTVTIWVEEVVLRRYFDYISMGSILLQSLSELQFTYLGLMIDLSVGVSVGLAASSRGDLSHEMNVQVLKVTAFRFLI